jgi:hypothetical protein
MKAGARLLCGAVLAVCMLAAMGGCDDTPAREVRLLTATQWNDSPGSIDEIGYQVHVDIGWPSRPTSCFPLSPDLRVTVNDHEPVPVVARADCEWDVLVTVPGFATDVDVTVKLHDGDRLLGEATYSGIFPGFTSWALVSPVDGRVRAGEPIAIAASTDRALYSSTVAAYFHWLDMAGPAPPFHSFATAAAAPDGLSAVVPAPPLTGRALMVVANVDEEFGVAASCTGFSSCESWPDTSTIGPMLVEVIP